MNPVSVAAKGKGAGNLARRARAIGAGYGVTPRRMRERLDSVVAIAERYGCGVTLPVTAAAVARNPEPIADYVERGVEFAVHGYHHVDHAQLGTVEQIEQLGAARRLLESRGIPAVGFRAPYLRWNAATMHALSENGFLYDSSQAYHFPIDPELESDGYRRGLEFYGSRSTDVHPSLPTIADGLVRIPCCLPDDESVVDRLQMTPEQIEALWVGMWRRAHARGELFTIQMHPERIEPCAPAVAAVLEEARSAPAKVWVAQLRDIASWWRERATAHVTIRDDTPGLFRVRVDGPPGVTVLARGVEVSPAEPAEGGYVRVPGDGCYAASWRRPFIGVHPFSAPSLTAFLRQQGYIVEVSSSPETHSCFLRRERFTPEDQLPLLREIENDGAPLVRLGRWPDGAHSAVAVTGDIDALTIWDYVYRFVGH